MPNTNSALPTVIHLCLLVMLFAGCSKGASGSPAPEGHGWVDGVYRIANGQQSAYVEVLGPDIWINGEKIQDLGWVNWFNEGQSQRWYQGTLRGQVAGIRHQYKVRYAQFIFDATPVLRVNQ